MAVGAGSIKRASKISAEAPAEKTTTAKATVTKTAATKTTTTKATAAKKTSAAKTTTKKATTEKKVVLPKEEPVANVMVPTPEVMQEVVKIASSRKVCRLTEDLPVHLL